MARVVAPLPACFTAPVNIAPIGPPKPKPTTVAGSNTAAVNTSLAPEKKSPPPSEAKLGTSWYIV